MVCKKCGAQILPDDQFCPECGAKVIRKKRCPECGELYRAGTKFCPNCGAETGEARSVKKSDSEGTPKKKTSAEGAPRRKADPAPPSKKRPVYREEPPRRRRDWEDEDWEDDDDEEESVDFLTIMTVIVGCVILVIFAVLGYNLYQRYVPKNYERAAEEQQEGEEEEGEDQDGEDGQDGDAEGGQALEEKPEEDGAEGSESGSGGTLVTTADVRIRTSPSTGSDSTVIRTAKKGETFEYIEAVEGGAWYQVMLSGEEYDYGYISADYVEPQ